MNQDKPQTTCQGITFFPVPEFDDVTAAFGPLEDAYFNRRQLPEVPKKYEKIVTQLFFKGGALPEMQPEVDREKATRAVGAWLRSFAPAHEAKTATAAYALWVWCEGDLSK